MSCVPCASLPPSSFFFFYCSGAHRDLHSFPTRRSSDLSALTRSDARAYSSSDTGQQATVNEPGADGTRSEEHTSELQSRRDLVCRLLLEKKKIDHGPAIEGHLVHSDVAKRLGARPLRIG